MLHRTLCRAKTSSAYSGAQAVAFGQGLVALLPQLGALTQILPPPTLQWKLQLLEEGNRCGRVPNQEWPTPRFPHATALVAVLHVDIHAGKLLGQALPNSAGR